MVDRKELFLRLVDRDLLEFLRHADRQGLSMLADSLWSGRPGRQQCAGELEALQAAIRCGGLRDSEMVRVLKVVNDDLAESLNGRNVCHRFKSEERYRALLEGKTVALVGAAGCLRGSAQGAQIDRHDLVVRLNVHLRVAPCLREDAGTRAQVLYHCCNGDQPVSAICGREFARLEYVCCQRNRESLELESRCRESQIPSLDFTEVSDSLTAVLGCRPNTGTSALVHLLTFPIKSVTAYGFSFFDHEYATTSLRAGPIAHRKLPQREYLLYLKQRDRRLEFNSESCRI